MTSKVSKLINKIKADLDKNYDMEDDLHDIAFVSIVIRNLPKKCFVPIDNIKKWRTAYLIEEFDNINLNEYIPPTLTPEEKKIKRRTQKNEHLKEWVKGKKHFCEICNTEMSYMSKSDHSRSKKHLKKIEEANNPPQEPVTENTI